MSSRGVSRSWIPGVPVPRSTKRALCWPYGLAWVLQCIGSAVLREEMGSSMVKAHSHGPEGPQWVPMIPRALPAPGGWSEQKLPSPEGPGTCRTVLCALPREVTVSTKEAETTRGENFLQALGSWMLQLRSHRGFASQTPPGARFPSPSRSTMVSG